VVLEIDPRITHMALLLRNTLSSFYFF
jgi:hypothetical protein